MLRSFLRFRVTINVTQPLTTGFWVPRREKGNVWVCLKYERLQGYCYNCGRIGHDQKICKAAKVMSLCNPQLTRYGPGLGVPTARSLQAIIRENESWRRNRQETEEEERARESSPFSSACDSQAVQSRRSEDKGCQHQEVTNLKAGTEAVGNR